MCQNLFSEEEYSREAVNEYILRERKMYRKEKRIRRLQICVYDNKTYVWDGVHAERNEREDADFKANTPAFVCTDMNKGYTCLEGHKIKCLENAESVAKWTKLINNLSRLCYYFRYWWTKSIWACILPVSCQCKQFLTIHRIFVWYLVTLKTYNYLLICV